MEAYSYASSSSSSASTYLSLTPQEEKKPKLPLSLRSSVLHSVRKPSAKPWKKHIAPLPPTPPRVYKVDSTNFKEVVQKLTGAPEIQTRRLQSVAPPPLNLATTPLSDDSDSPPPLQLFPSPEKTPSSAIYPDLMTDTLDTNPRNLSDSLTEASPFGFSLSPSSYTWCSLPLLSPGTLSSLEQSIVL